MVAAPFRYERVTSFEEAARALRERGEDAKVIAGGQSLVPMLNLRLARPAWLIDINPVGAGPIEDHGGYLRLPALTRHRAIEAAEVVRRRCPILAEAAACVGNVRTRTRGTIGGSLAHADPAGELPCVAVALGAEVTVQGPDGARDVPVGDLLVSYLTTTRTPPAPTGGAWPRSSAGGRSPRRRRGRAATGGRPDERPRQAARRLHRQRRAAGGVGVPARQPPGRAPGRPRPPRGPLRLRRGGVRDLHGPARRRAGQRLPAAGGAGRRLLAGDRARPRPGRRWRRPPPPAGVLPPPRRRAVRLLHARHAAHRVGAAAARPAAQPRADPPGADRQPVPLHRLQQDPGRGPGARRAGGGGDRRPWLTPRPRRASRRSGSSGSARRTTTSSTRSRGRCCTRPTGSSPACSTAGSCGPRCRAPGSPPWTCRPRGRCRAWWRCSRPPTCRPTRWSSAPPAGSVSWPSPCRCSPPTASATRASRSPWSPPSPRRSPPRPPSWSTSSTRTWRASSTPSVPWSRARRWSTTRATSW